MFLGGFQIIYRWVTIVVEEPPETLARLPQITKQAETIN